MPPLIRVVQLSRRTKAKESKSCEEPRGAKISVGLAPQLTLSHCITSSVCTKNIASCEFTPLLPLILIGAQPFNPFAATLSSDAAVSSGCVASSHGTSCVCRAVVVTQNSCCSPRQPDCRGFESYLRFYKKTEGTAAS